MLQKKFTMQKFEYNFTKNNKTMGIEICGITEIYIIALSARDLFRIAR